MASPHIGHSRPAIDFSCTGSYGTRSLMSGMTLRPSGGDSVMVRAADDPRDDGRWFGDEVAIDFPSIAPAVDRIRSAFIAAERSTPLTSAIDLSWHEARRGATLPLDIPVCCVCR